MVEYTGLFVWRRQTPGCNLILGHFPVLRWEREKEVLLTTWDADITIYVESLGAPEFAMQV